MRISIVIGAVLSISMATGCVRYGPPPETVAYVDVERYVGLWHEIASNPVFFNRDLVGVTAEYGDLGDNKVSVLNTGYTGEIAEENKTTIKGVATVVDVETNSKLKVQFDMPFGFLFRGNYWIVLLDEDAYQYAVVTDNRQFTLFILCRTPDMDEAVYDEIRAALEAKQIDISRLRVTGTLN